MKHRFNFLIYPDMQPMDLIGPWEVIATWKMLFPDSVEMQIVGEHQGPMQCLNHITISSHTDFANAFQADYLVIPGGFGRIKEVHNSALIQFIQQQAKHCKRIISVCTGAFLVAEAGLVTHKKATTYWRALPEFIEIAKQKNIIVSEQRIIKDEKIWFAGGISSGIDLAFALIEDIAGAEIAGETQLAFEYFPMHTMYAKLPHVEKLPRYPTLAEGTPVHLAAYIREQLEKE